MQGVPQNAVDASLFTTGPYQFVSPCLSYACASSQSVEVADKLRASAAQEFDVLSGSCERLRAQLMELTADVAKHEEKQRMLKVCACFADIQM